MARTDPKVSHTTAVNIWAPFLRQPQQRSSCCRQAMWLYQGWAIRGWNNAEGASRLKALYDVVPHGQWVVSDMDVDGIWRYFGNYSFFGSPFIWTTLHDFGGNDGLKGDMTKLAGMPGDALVRGRDVAGIWAAFF